MSRKTGDGTNTPEVSTSAQDPSNSGAMNMWTITDFVARFDETAKRRLENMNQKLRDIERQMEALEAEISKVNASSKVDFS